MLNSLLAGVPYCPRKIVDGYTSTALGQSNNENSQIIIIIMKYRLPKVKNERWVIQKVNQPNLIATSGDSLYLNVLHRINYQFTHILN